MCVQTISAYYLCFVIKWYTKNRIVFFSPSRTIVCLRLATLFLRQYDMDVGRYWKGTKEKRKEILMSDAWYTRHVRLPSSKIAPTHVHPPCLASLLALSFATPSLRRYDIESRFYDAPARERPRCKFLFANLEEIRTTGRVRSGQVPGRERSGSIRACEIMHVFMRG